MGSRLIMTSVLLLAVAAFPDDVVRSQNPSSGTAEHTPKKSDETEKLQRRAFGFLLDGIDDAKKIEEPLERARFLAQAADLIWKRDEVLARDLFQQAWKLVTKDDAPLDSFGMSTSRGEILSRLGARDHDLADGLRTAFVGRTTENFEPFPYPMPREGRPWLFGYWQRWGNWGWGFDTGMAGSFDSREWTAAYISIVKAINAGDKGTAIGMLQRFLSTAVPYDSLDLLNRLRRIAPAEADGIYAGLLNRHLASPFVPPEMVVVLYTYLFRPGVDPDIWATTGIPPHGAANLMMPPRNDTPWIVRQAYFDAAASILLRPTPQDERLLPANSRMPYSISLDNALNLLIPRFAAEAPQYLPALQDRKTEIQAVLAGYPDRPADPAPLYDLDALEDRLKQLSSARGAINDINLGQLVQLLAASGKSSKAFELAGKIQDAQLRKEAIGLGALAAANQAASASDIEGLLDILRRYDLPPARKVSLLTRIAILAAKKDKTLAQSEIAEARKTAEKITDLREHVQALAEIASAAIEADREQAWEVISEAVELVNKAGEKSDDDKPRESAEPFLHPLSTSFARLAKIDWDRAVLLANDFDSPAAKAWMKLAVAKSQLGNQPKK